MRRGQITPRSASAGYRLHHQAVLTTAPDEPTLLETADGGAAAVWLVDDRVVVLWHEPHRTELSADGARALGYVLRAGTPA